MITEEITGRSYDPEYDSCIISIRRMNKDPAERSQSREAVPSGEDDRIISEYHKTSNPKIIAMSKTTNDVKIKYLYRAVKLKEELKATEREKKEAGFLMRTLPVRKRKLFTRQEELSREYNDLIQKKKLPLRKVI